MPRFDLRWVLLGAAAALTAGVVIALALGAFRTRDPACTTQRFEGTGFVVCAFDPTRHELRLASRDDDGVFLRSFVRLGEALGDDAPRVRFAMNAGMFNEQGAPIGLFVSEGRRQHRLRLTDGPGNFHMKPNGVFWVGEDGAPHVDTSETYAREHPQARWATQSGPMLVIDGVLHPRFAENGESRLIRNGVGVTADGRALFVISGPVSFGRFARFFRDALDCDDALFFDGTVSSLWAPQRNRRDSAHELGPMVVVLDAEAP